MSTASRGTTQGGANSRWRPQRATLAILGGIALVTFASMLIALPAFGIWPPRSHEGVVITPNSLYAAGVGVEIVGTPVAMAGVTTNTIEVLATPIVMTDTFQTVTMTVRITNNVMQHPKPEGTVLPNAPTPLPVSAKILNASVKVLFYDLPRSDPNKKIVGSGVGNYFSAEGLEPGASAELVVVATDVGEFDKENGYEAFADGLWTDLDPLGTPEPISYYFTASARQPALYSPSSTP